MTTWWHGSRMQGCYAVVPRTDSDRFFVKPCGCTTGHPLEATR